MIILAFLFFQLLNLTQIQANCDTKCGDIHVQYPFGTDPSCAHDGFVLTCDQSERTPKLFIGNGSIEVLNISLHDGTILVKTKVVSSTLLDYNESWTGLPISGPYSVSTSRNIFVAMGCGVLVQLNSNQQVVSACASVCVGSDSLLTDGSCTGIGCCATSLPNISLSSVNFELKSLNETPISTQGFVNKAFIVEKGWFGVNAPSLEGNFINGLNGDNNFVIPVLLDWRIKNSDCKIAKKNLTDFACKSANSLCIDLNNSAGYRCGCEVGFQGNSYVENGCQDINECNDPKLYPCEGICLNTQGSYNCICADGMYSADPKAKTCVPDSKSRPKGTIPLSGAMTDQDARKSYGMPIDGILIGVGIFICVMSLPVAVTMILYERINARRLKMTREKWFKQNQGLLLQQLISSNEYIGEKMKIFSLKELEKATNQFDVTRVVGRGGHGVVFKGILSDQRVVAIKRSQIAVQSEIDQFINEVVILSQIDHRNVVKLYGCCLESEVPLLVYEFISNGTLWGHLHVEDNSLLSWDDRFRIALEIARALAHLHSTASVSIFHRDIKSSNILLDDYLTAKLSDFGASRLIQINHTGITTSVQGTFGYLDPEYFYTGRLTEKSDVYSFGVILAELLTREKPISSSRFQEGENLVAYFCSTMRESNLNEIIDPEITGEEHRAEIEAVALLAEPCLRMKGEERPTMKEIETKLQVLNGSKKRDLRLHRWGEERSNERESVLNQLVGGDNSRQYSLECELVSSSHFPR
ncbi:hypothetical protein LUZ60_003333 [Juncus effusus]|nr:hypothetical protein LUZ60_003333 [Juncus effusus]